MDEVAIARLIALESAFLALSGQYLRNAHPDKSPEQLLPLVDELGDAAAKQLRQSLSNPGQGLTPPVTGDAQDAHKRLFQKLKIVISVDQLQD